ncbi:MAG TPA: DUF5666 domain-containing protein [Candidatus Eisenbacteria bacterium]|nr:DUF5666 domain-containing protein [Candidatus Eisenbacteria bacterium]
MIIAVLLVVLALGGGFFAGMQYQKQKSPMLAGGTGNGQFFRRFGQNGQNMQAVRPVRGEVLSVDDTGMTVKMMDGSSKIVVVSGSTVFVKSSTAAKADVKSGDTVMVIGTQNSDGSVTAQDVQINPPAMGRGFAPSSATPTSAAQ